MKVIFESIYDRMDRAIAEAKELGKNILKFVVNPAEFDELWPSVKLGYPYPSNLFYSLIPVEVEI